MTEARDAWPARISYGAWRNGPIPQDFGNARQHDRFAVGEFGDKRQASTHGFNGLSQSGDHQVGAPPAPRYWR
jgi:hypothetical protein